MPRYYELDVSLQEIQPRIWRRLLLRSTATFAQLHQAIQESFGWQDYHLYEFRLPTHQGRVIAGIPDDEDLLERPTPDARHVKLSSYFTGISVVEWCEYLYDFGDGWAHDVKLLGVHTDKETFKRKLLDGERAAPPEDCGGIPGYESMATFVETGRVQSGEDPDDVRAWLGDWHPDAFDLEKVRARFDR